MESVLGRLLDDGPVPPAPARTTSAPTTTANTQRSLSRLLQSERIHGTSERDPTQKRHDFRYFSRHSRYVLVEDMQGALATIAAHEYLLPRGMKDEDIVKPPWPVAHCHPHSRGPFVAFDEKEKKRWEKSQLQEKQKQAEHEAQQEKILKAEEMKRTAEAQLHAKKFGDLRRSVSMSNLHRRATHSLEGRDFPLDLEQDADNLESANASGYLASGTGGYMAASGNSVGMTSTTGTTSTSSYLRKVTLPSALSGRMKQQVVTSRKFPTAADKLQAERNAGAMGPPRAIPERQALLRKSKSMNTMKLAKREEGVKPGYCESCRVKFEDFKLVGLKSFLHGLYHLIQ